MLFRSDMDTYVPMTSINSSAAVRASPASLPRTFSSSVIRDIGVDPNTTEDTFCDLAQAGSISEATLFPESSGLRTCAIHNTCPLCSAQVAGMAPILEELRTILRQQFLENCRPLLTSVEQSQLDNTLRTGEDPTGIIRKCDAKFAEANPLNQASIAKNFRELRSIDYKV